MLRRLVFSQCLLILLLLAPASVSANPNHPVHMHSKELEARLAEWQRRALSEIEFLLKTKAMRVGRWKHWVREIPSTSEAEQLSAVNELINREIHFKSDYAAYGTYDYWATLSESLSRGGDSEDFALAKATTLLYLGWPEERLHLVIGIHPAEPNEAHSVLLVQVSDGSYWALDNYSKFIIPAKEMKMKPYYGVSKQGLWDFK